MKHSRLYSAIILAASLAFMAWSAPKILAAAFELERLTETAR